MSEFCHQMTDFIYHALRFDIITEIFSFGGMCLAESTFSRKVKY